jgi:hypothetical protein
MAARPRNLPLALGLAVGSLLLVAACALQAVRADLADQNPEAALAWGLANPDALSAVAEARQRDVQLPDHDAEATKYARQALIAAPLDEQAMRVLGLETDQAGGHARARMMMVVADQWSRRDTLVQLWLLQQALFEGDWRGASLHVDALLRRRWQLETVVYPALIGRMGDPNAIAPLIDRLDQNPDWRGGFLRALAGHSADPALAARLFEALARTPAPPSDEESGYIVGRYLAQGDLAGARALWSRLLPPGSGPTTSLVYNGDFRPRPGAPPFNWQLVQSDGANVEIVPAADGSSALHVVAPAAKNAAAAQQLLVLPPGAYRLSGVALVEPGLAGDQFSWRVICAGQAGGGGAEVRQGSGAEGWRSFAVDFQIADHGCGAQWLTLEGLAHEGFQPAEAWYRGLDIQPLPAATRSG